VVGIWLFGKTEVKFSELINGLERHEDEWCVTPGGDWLQGRTVFGGLAAALCVEAGRLAYPDAPPLRSAQFAFAGPAVGRLRLRPVVLRQGKSALFLRIELAGEQGLATHATLCFAAQRPSALVQETIAYPASRSPDECLDVFDGAPRSLAFLQHVEARLAAGGRPFSQGKPEMTVWLRHRDRQAPSTVTSAIALADAPPPAALVLASRPGPISTMTWSFDILSDDANRSAGWWLSRTISEATADGYSSHSTMLWSPSGVPVLASRQHLALFL
jgi:hypothetical protein